MSMKKLLGLFFSIVALVIVLVGFVPAKYPQLPTYIGGGVVNEKQYAKILKPENEPFPSEIKEVEDTWGEPIPEHLLQTGGMDLYSWASIYHNPKDPPHIFRGEFRDRERLYKGRFEYVQEDGMPLPAKPLNEFYMGGASENNVYFYAISPKDGFVYFKLRPIDGEVIYSGSLEAEEYRQSRR